MKQGTAEWHQARLGKVTASRISDVMARTKSGYGAGRKNYMAELLVERLTGEPAESFISSAMQWGTDHEAEARTAYEFETAWLVSEVGFVDHPAIAFAGASPDGLVGEDGLVEIKCPNTATHIDTLLTKRVDRRYLLQMQWQMECTARQWNDYFSYDPRLVGHTWCLIRVERDDAMLSDIRTEVEAFLADLATLQAAVEAL